MLMRKITLFLIALVCLFSSGYAVAATTIYMPNEYDDDNPRTATITEPSTLTYDGYWAETDMSSPAFIYLKPATAGESVRVKFTQVYGFDSSVELKVYNGQTDVSASWAWSLPAGDLGAAAEGAVYESTAADGSLTVAYYCGDSAAAKWSAEVETFSNADMEYSGAEAAPVGVAEIVAGAASQPLMAVNVKTAGASNALSVTKVAFNLSGSNAADFSNLKIYSTGRSSSFALSDAVLFGTVSSDGTAVAATGSQTLTGGDNYFWLVGDVAASAALGGKVAAECTSLQVGGEEKLTAPLAAADLSVGNTLLMPTAGVYSVGPSGLTFYDDGGKDGKISAKFEGTVTFKPTTPGKVVQVDFSKVAIYESMYGSDTYNDVLKVYNGQGTSDLIEQVKNGEQKIVRSTASDGSLTVYLKTIQSSSYNLKDGFEATVSEYSPAPMTVAAVETAQGEGSMAAGDTGKAVLSINVKTQNTIAIDAQSFTFTSEGTTDLSHITKATLYYTGKSAAFAATEKVGEAVPAGQKEFTISCAQTLVEGNNYFWLTYDLDPQAVTGETLDAGCKSVTAGGSTYTPATVNPEGVVEVKNEVLSTVGTVEKTVYGTWVFKSTPNPLSYYDGYEPVSGDQITTFIPGTDGKIIELDIQSFELYYTTSSYAPKAKFEVYSGRGTTGELLWSLASVDDSKTGPGKLLRSKSADGALTVVFNANTTSSSYTAKGWTSEVREYQSRPMAVETITATQASTDIVNQGAKGVELLDVDVTTSGDLSALLINGLTLDLKGSQTAIEKIYVYPYGTDGNPSATAAATVDVTADMTEAVAVFTRTLELSEGGNRYRVACDVKSDAAIDSKIDAALTAVKIGDSNVAVSAENGDPAGERTVKNVYLLASGNNGEVIVGDDNLMFYDAGGKDGQTTKNFEGTVTFVPKDAGKAVKMTVKSFSVGYNDSFYVDYGGEVKTTHDFRAADMEALPTIVSTADDGKLTVYYKVPSYSYASDGFEIELVQHELQPLSAASVTVETVAPASTVRGATGVAMVHAAVEVAGDKGSLDFAKFAVSAAGTTDNALSAVAVYATGTASDFSANDRIAESSEAPYELTSDYSVTAPGVYHFWIAADPASAANPGDVVSLSLESITAGGTPVVPATSVTATTTLRRGKSGELTVGEGGDYATIQAAIDDISTGIEGPVVITVKKGEYKELVTVPAIVGASVANTITLRGETGDYNDVTISYDRYTEPPYSDDKMSNEYGVFTFSGADYFTLKDVTLTTTDLTFPSVVHFRDGNTHCTIDHCHVYAEQTTSTSEDINLIYQYSKDETCNNDYTTVRNSLIEGGYIGLRLTGVTSVNAVHQRGSIVEGNTFRNQGSKSLYAAGYEVGLTVRGNVVENTTTTKSDFNAFDLQVSEGLLTEGNSISLRLSNYTNAFYLRKSAGTAEQPGRIVNNEIYVESASTSSTSSALKVNNPSTYTDIAYNTLVVAGDKSGSTDVALYLNDKMENFTVANNAIQAKNGGLVYRFYKDNCVEGITFSNNALYTSGSVFAKTSSSSELSTYGEWLTRSGETGSYNEAVDFFSSTILLPAAEGNLRNAKPLAYVATDIQGTARDADRPTIGAYEYADASAVPAYADGYPSFSGIADTKADALLTADANGSAFLVVKPSADAAPTADEVKASDLKAELRKGKEAEVALTGLTRQTEYRLYSVLASLDGTAFSDVLVSEPFTTTFPPTEVSTFENVAVSGDGFEDGTALFTGFTVETAEDAVVDGDKVAKVGETATIALTNTEVGLTLNGFFLKSDADVAMTVYNAAGETQSYTLAATSGKWIFSNLKDKGALVAIDMATAGNAYIDNFSGEPLALAVAVDKGEAEIAAGATASFSAAADGGVYPYTFVWTDAMSREVASAEAFTTPELDRSAAYMVTVADAWGNKVSDRALVYVAGETFAATFDDNYLSDESYFNGFGEDEEGWYGPGVETKYFSGSFEFTALRHTSTWWEGVGYSNQTSTEFEGLADQYRSAVGGGHNSGNYGVVYAYTGAPYVVGVSNSRTDGAAVSGFYVSNSAYTVDAILNGDGMSTVAGGFQKGDYFKLVVTAEKADGTTGTLDYYLADYRSDNEADHYYLDTWQWVDLRQLGNVRKFSFSFEGTKRNTLGLTTPTYFCLDDFGGEREIADAPKQLVGTSEAVETDLAQFFTLADDGSTVVYAITDPADAEKAEVAIAGGKLVVKGLKDLENVEVIVSATQKGRIQFVRIPVEIDEAKASVAEMGVSDGLRVYPVPATDRLNIATSMEDYQVEVFSASGARVYTQSGLSGNAAIPVSQFAKGVYILTVSDGDRTITKRFIVK